MMRMPWCTCAASTGAAVPHWSTHLACFQTDPWRADTAAISSESMTMCCDATVARPQSSLDGSAKACSPASLCRGSAGGRIASMETAPLTGKADHVDRTAAWKAVLEKGAWCNAARAAVATATDIDKGSCCKAATRKAVSRHMEGKSAWAGLAVGSKTRLHNCVCAAPKVWT